MKNGNRYDGSQPGMLSKMTEYSQKRLKGLLKMNQGREAKIQKECNTCHQVKHVTEFAPRRARCRECANAIVRAKNLPKKRGHGLTRKVTDESDPLYDKMARMKW